MWRWSIALCRRTGAKGDFVWHQKASTNEMNFGLLVDIAVVVVAAGVSVVAGFLLVHFWFECRDHWR